MPGVSKNSNGKSATKPKQQKKKSRGARESVSAVPGMAVKASSSPPQFSKPQQARGQRSTTHVCVRRELVQQVVGTAAFSAVAYPINAALAQMFAWLSSEARRYEKYRFTKLFFEYVNAISPADATNAGGNVAFAVDLDVLDAAPATLQKMMQNESALLFSPYDKSKLVINPRDLARRGWLYTRSGGVPTGADAKTYDLGSFILAQSGCSTNGLGNLFVEYEVELDVPQEVGVDSQKITGSAGLTAIVAFGTNAASSAGSVSAWTVNTAGDTLTCAVAGDYLFLGIWEGTTLTGIVSNCAPGGTATSTEFTSGTFPNPGATALIQTFAVRASVGQTIMPSINSAASVTATTWRISSYNYALA